MSVLAGAGALTWAWVGYLAVVTVVLYFAALRVLRSVAARHRDDDANAGAKVGVAALLGILLAAGGIWTFNTLQASGEEGIHDSFIQHVNQAVGESEYQSNFEAIQKKIDAIAIQITKIAEGNATIAAETPGTEAYEKAVANRDAVVKALTTSREELALARAMVEILHPNHLVWEQVKDQLAAGEDEAVREHLEKGLSASTIHEILPIEEACVRAAANKGGLCVQPLQWAPLWHDYKDSHQAQLTYESGLEEAYHVQHFSVEQMDMQILLFGYPMVTGFALAPFAFAGGSILGRAFRETDTVGYKPYPGKSMGWFLLLGGLFVLAAPFAAWMVWDMSRRSKEGQISL